LSEIDKILKIKQTGLNLESGNLLVSTPLLHDFFFGHSVILLVEHEQNSSMGFILNNMTEDLVCDIVPELDGVYLPIFIGGPVNHDRAFFVHNNKEVQDSIPLNNGLYWGGDIEQVKKFIKDKIISEHDIRFFIGYSGWTAQQLENEIKTDSWIIADPKPTEELLHSNPDYLWKTTVSKLGYQYKKWFNFPINPMDN